MLNDLANSVTRVNRHLDEVSRVNHASTDERRRMATGSPGYNYMTTVGRSAQQEAVDDSPCVLIYNSARVSPVP